MQNFCLGAVMLGHNAWRTRESHSQKAQYFKAAAQAIN